VRCAAAIADEVRELGIEILAGIHTGQTEDQGGKAQGIAVVIGARVMSLAGEGELLVTSTTKELVTGSGFGFEDVSAHELKGVPGSWQVFAVTSVDAEPRARALAAAEAAERRRTIARSSGGSGAAPPPVLGSRRSSSAGNARGRHDGLPRRRLDGIGATGRRGTGPGIGGRARSRERGDPRRDPCSRWTSAGGRASSAGHRIT
jgi:hypothetical protein